MENKQAKNTDLVKIIIGLHEQGYSEDFFLNEKKELIWGQKGDPIRDFTLDLLNIQFPAKQEPNTFVYRITLHSGIKGILLSQNNQMDTTKIKNRFPNAH